MNYWDVKELNCFRVSPTGFLYQGKGKGKCKVVSVFFQLSTTP
jgi:hypothetical protein